LSELPQNQCRAPSFETTHRFCLAVGDNSADRATLAMPQGLCKKMAHFGAPAVQSRETVDSESKKLLQYNNLNKLRP